MRDSNYRKTIAASVAAGLTAGAILFGAGFATGRINQVPRAELETRIARATVDTAKECDTVLDSLPGFDFYSVWPGSATTADYAKAYENMLRMRCPDIGQ